MEAQRRNTTSSSAMRRKPLSDCSNTILPLGSSAFCSSFSSSSDLLKKPLKSFASSSQHLHSGDNVNPTETHLDKVQSKTGSTTGAGLGSSTSTPVRRQRNPPSTVGGDDVWEPSPVYVRRHSGSKRKDKEKAIDMPAIKSQSSRDKIDEDGGTGLSKSLIVAHKKKIRQATEVRDDNEDTSFIEQQKAYFAEIDAFELLEEEVASADELE
ncbi:unnamed protein product [Linum tenue]|uniref:Sororin C-terminal region domain-containing protein n=1 Tax=Linum tenue TaxID=586396 RepID=A0AAV0J5K6_9ROSI|nr:unnamed protein product [Linum tenue]